jgi:hypothetical protein
MESCKWISVKFALPPIGQSVIIVDNKDTTKIGVGFIQKYGTERIIMEGERESRQFPVWSSTHNIYHPTHWMYTPSAV